MTYTEEINKSHVLLYLSCELLLCHFERSVTESRNLLLAYFKCSQKALIKDLSASSRWQKEEIFYQSCRVSPHPPWERRNWGGFALCHAEFISASMLCHFERSVTESRNLLLEFDKGSLRKVEMTKGRISPQGRSRKHSGKVWQKEKMKSGNLLSENNTNAQR
jgi:hypothetical protein